MKSKNIMPTNFGFSLVELMVGLSIIAVIISMLSPTYEKYIIKAKMMEGPILLSQFYLAERQIYTDTGTYVACVFALGIPPDDKGYFVLGFQNNQNYGKYPALVPNCEPAGAAQATRGNCGSSFFREIECTGGNPQAKSDYAIIPKILLKRGGGTEDSFVQPYTDTDDGIQCVSHLTDANGVDGGGVGLAPYATLKLGYSRLDTKFTACALAAFGKDSTGRATEFIINEQKQITLVNQGF